MNCFTGAYQYKGENTFLQYHRCRLLIWMGSCDIKRHFWRWLYLQMVSVYPLHIVLLSLFKKINSNCWVINSLRLTEKVKHEACQSAQYNNLFSLNSVVTLVNWESEIFKIMFLSLHNMFYLPSTMYRLLLDFKCGMKK